MKNILSIKFYVLIIAFLVIFIVDLITATSDISLKDIIQTLLYIKRDYELQKIIFEIRIPKILTAVLAGIALSVSGLQMQTVFRNPLAGPYVLGISAGASLGVAIVIMGFSSIAFIENTNVLSHWAQIVAACVGSGIVLMVILFISFKVKDIMTILILGILIGGITSAFISIMQYYSSKSLLKSYVLWTFGSFSNVTNDQLFVLLMFVGLGIFLSFLSIKQLNALLLGENYAKTMGMNINKARVLIFVSTSLLTGGITAFCGPIGFIGIVVPHLARLYCNKADHKILLPATILIGAIVLLLCDLITQIPKESILPVNSVTALLGIPIVVWLIIRNKPLSGF